MFFNSLNFTGDLIKRISFLLLNHSNQQMSFCIDSSSGYNLRTNKSFQKIYR